MDSENYDIEEGHEEIENFLGSELVLYGETFNYYIEKSFNSTFMANQFIDSAAEKLNINTHYDIDLPTTVVLGNYDNKDQFMVLTFFTYDYELDEDEDLSITVEKLKKHLYRTKGITKDFDFCMISYPILKESSDFTEDCVYEYALESIIFNTTDFIGGAVSKRAVDHNCEECEKCYNFQVQYLLNSNGNMSHRQLRKIAHKNSREESYAFSTVVENYFKLPSIASKESLYEFIEDIKKDRLKVITSKESILDELVNEVVSLPLEGFILSDEAGKSREEIMDTMKTLIAATDFDGAEGQFFIDSLNDLLGEEE